MLPHLYLVLLHSLRSTIAPAEFYPRAINLPSQASYRLHLPRALYYTTLAKPARPKGWKAVLVMAPVEMANTARQGSGLRATGRVLAIPNGATGNGEERRGGVE